MREEEPLCSGRYTQIYRIFPCQGGQKILLSYQTEVEKIKRA